MDLHTLSRVRFLEDLQAEEARRLNEANLPREAIPFLPPTGTKQPPVTALAGTLSPRVLGTKTSQPGFWSGKSLKAGAKHHAHKVIGGSKTPVTKSHTKVWHRGWHGMTQKAKGWQSS
jgi:hypothetical protein